MTNSRSKLGEFDLIAKYFAPLAAGAPGAFGLKDDAATIALEPGQELVVTTDLLSAGIHFFPGDPPELIARKSLRVNLSDLAAKGAKPEGYLLSLALPHDIAADWISSFAEGLAEDQREFGVALFGGDTTATNGSVTISITAFGMLPSGSMTKRSGAKPGDIVFVTGTIGDAAKGLSLLGDQTKASYTATERALIRRYRLPEPRVAFGQKIRGVATAALDVSDGLVADVEHIADASRVRMTVGISMIPLSDHRRRTSGASESEIIAAATGGDDYEIAFAAPADKRAVIQKLAEETRTPVSEIGRVEVGEGVSLVGDDGSEIAILHKGYKHF
jgi:thiamine-monophosphate kinase